MVFTTHLKQGDTPVLVAEGGSWLAGIFGWLWFAVRGEWLAAIVLLGINLLLMRFCAHTHTSLPLLALLILQGAFATDILRLTLALRGYSQGPVVVARDGEAALGRLLDTHPDLAPLSSGAGAAFGTGF